MGRFLDLSAMNSPDNKKIKKEFGIALEKYRNARGFSQRDLAYAVDKDQGQIAKYEKGLINPTLTTIYRLAEALEIDPCQLLTFAS